MARLVSPPRNQLHILRTPLTPGEKTVFDLFDARLPESWEIYIQPHLNGLRPDFVLLNPEVGIAVFEVKDWDLDALEYWHWRDSEGRPQLWATSPDGKRFRVSDDPVKKALQYKEQILELYCPRLGTRVADVPRARAVITAGIILTRATTKRARDLLCPILESQGIRGPAARYHPVAGWDAIRGRDLDRIFPEHRRHRSRYMSPELAQDLRSWLFEPDHAATQREPLPLDAKQHELVTTRTAIGYRRIRGPAGSGKSLVLAARAAQLAMEGRDVLVVTFNITLLHYLRDLAVRYPAPGRGFTNRITWLHFHGWCRRVCEEAGSIEEYKALWRGRGDGTDDGDDRILTTELPRLVHRVIEQAGGRVSRYDAILVDEGQDFNLDWWNLLRTALRPGGEMLLVADESQDIYGRTRTWTEEKMEGAGFSGPWVRLGPSYRLPEPIVPLLRQYVREHLPEMSANLPEAVRLDPSVFRQAELPFVKLYWIQTTRERAVEAAVWALLSTPTFVEHVPIVYSDITLLTASHHLGLECVQALKGKGINTLHIFDPDSRKRRAMKNLFFMGDGRTKACTIHSFKGWETRALVVLVDAVRSVEDRALVYVALTRLKRHTSGSMLTVVCTAPKLETFGKTWPDFRYFPPTGGIDRTVLLG